MSVEKHIRRLGLSYFELEDPVIRSLVVEMFAGRRMYDYLEEREIAEALDRLREEMLT